MNILAGFNFILFEPMDVFIIYLLNIEIFNKF